MLEKLSIENFTAFRKAEFDFVPGINVLVGGNATGKTHVMKLLYTLHRAQMQKMQTKKLIDIAEILDAVFHPENLADLIHRNGKTALATAVCEWNGQRYGFDVSGNNNGGSVSPDDDTYWTDLTAPAFIPTKDILANSLGFLSLYDQRNIDFDEIYRNVLILAYTPSLRQSSRDKTDNRLLNLIADKIEGHVVVRGQRFYLVNTTGELEIHLVAEGWRKLALLYLLIANGFLNGGSVLYWDEPETSLNPSLMDDVIGILLELARRGVQIFLATHDYIILKELDLQRKETDEIRHFALERKEKGAVTVHPAASYIELNPNLIAAQFERLYDMEIDRALGGANAS